jgi:hypothetical protein
VVEKPPPDLAQRAHKVRVRTRKRDRECDLLLSFFETLSAPGCLKMHEREWRRLLRPGEGGGANIDWDAMHSACCPVSGQHATPVFGSAAWEAAQQAKNKVPGDAVAGAWRPRQKLRSTKQRKVLKRSRRLISKQREVSTLFNRHTAEIYNYGSKACGVFRSTLSLPW